MASVFEFYFPDKDSRQSDKALHLVGTGRAGRVLKMMGRAAGQEIYNAVIEKVDVPK